MTAEGVLRGTFNLLSTNMIKSVDQMIKKLIASGRASSARPPFANTKGSKIEGDNIRRGRREEREGGRRGGIIDHIYKWWYVGVRRGQCRERI